MLIQQGEVTHAFSSVNRRCRENRYRCQYQAAQEDLHGRSLFLIIVSVLGAPARMNR